MSTTFRALSVRNYRFYFGGQLLSNTGTWMQRIAQDWLVLQLSGGSGTALGITTGLQFLPFLLFSLWGGTLADRFSRRTLLMTTQALLGLLAIGLGITTLTGHASVALVFGFAFLLGVVSSIDNPARQAFVSEMVSKADLPNAVALNAASFNLGRLVGPAVAGLLIALAGSGWVFLLNGLSFGVTIAALGAMRVAELLPQERRAGAVRLKDGLRYVRARRDLVLILVIVFVVGTFGLNFQLTLALMAQDQFGLGAAAYGSLSTAMAVGATAGSLLSARRTRVPLRLVGLSALAFAVVEIVVGLSPTYLVMIAILPVVGILSMTFTNSAQAYVQLNTDSWVRGRVMGVYMCVFMGGTPIGAPVIGWAADQFGPRTGVVGGGLIALVLAAAAMAVYVRTGRRRDALADDPGHETLGTVAV